MRVRSGWALQVVRASACAATMALSMSGAFMASAAEDSSDDTAAAEEDAVQRREVIVVTATRRDTDIQSTPISVSALGGDQLSKAGAENIRNLTQLVPNIFVGESGGAGSTPVTIRGIGDNQLGLGGDGSVAIYIDGVYQGRPYANVFDFADVDRLEVLRGPQGTLYGRNATGGAINVITRKATDEPRFFADATFGNYDFVRLSAGGSGALVDGKVYAGVNATWSDRSGYSRNLFDGKDYNAEKTFNAQAHLRFAPTEALEIILRGDTGHNDASLVFTSYIEVLDPATFPFNPASVIGFTDRDDLDKDNVDINSVPPFEDRDWWGGSVEINHEGQGFDFKSLTAYRENSLDESTDADATRFNLAVYELFEDQKQFSQDLVFTSNGSGSIDWVLGASYYNEETVGYQHTEIPIFGPPVFVDVNASNKTDAYALFAEVTFALTDRLRVTGGLRYSDETKSYTFEQTSIGLDNISELSGELSFDAWTPSIVVDYRANDSVYLYASANQGFKSGGFSAINPVALATSPDGRPDAFGPEDVVAYEIGAKTNWLGDRATVNAALFYYDYKDIQTNATDAIGFAKVVPAGKAEVSGAEIEGRFALTPELELNFAASYLDAEFKSAVSFPDGLGGVTSRDLNGNSLPRAPKESLALGVNYSKDYSFGTLDFRLDGKYVGASFLTEANDKRLQQQSYTNLNARASYQTPNDRVRVTAFVHNITDVRPRAFGSVILGTVARGPLMPPQTYGVKLSYNY